MLDCAPGDGAASTIEPLKPKPNAMCLLSAKRCMTDIDGLAPGMLPWKTQILVGVPVAVSIWEKCMSMFESLSMRVLVCRQCKTMTSTQIEAHAHPQVSARGTQWREGGGEGGR